VEGVAPHAIDSDVPYVTTASGERIDCDFIVGADGYHDHPDAQFRGVHPGARPAVPGFRNRVFNAAVARCMENDDTLPRLTPHDLRHTAASLAVSAGANVKSVQRMLGHASAAMTLDERTRNPRIPLGTGGFPWWLRPASIR